MPPAVTGQVRTTDNKVILAAWNRKPFITGNARNVHADDNHGPNLGHSQRMSAGWTIGTAACG
eukprot:7642942-Prorocentrum_lima.AAC.1